MILRTLLLLVIAAIAELLLLLWLADVLGFGFVVGEMVATAILGVVLGRWQAARPVTAKNLLDPFILPIATTLMVVPGVLTDLVGLAIFIPPLRARLVGSFLRKASGGFDPEMFAKLQRGARWSGDDLENPPRRDEVIDSRLVE